MPLKKHSFAIGFLGTLSVFIILNLLLAHIQSDCGLLGLLNLAGCSDDISRAGFPLRVWETGGFAFHQEFNWLALIIDIIIALTISIGIGLAAQSRNRQPKYQ